MINKCPHCGFEPLNGKLACPQCGQEIKENIAQKLADIKAASTENEGIKWTDFKDVSLGAVMDQYAAENKTPKKIEPFKKNLLPDEESNDDIVISRKSTDDSAKPLEEMTAKQQELRKADSEADQTEKTAPVEDTSEDNPILAAYIRQHRGEEPVDEAALLKKIAEESKGNKAVNEATEPVPEAEDQDSVVQKASEEGRDQSLATDLVEENTTEELSTPEEIALETAAVETSSEAAQETSGQELAEEPVTAFIPHDAPHPVEISSVDDPNEATEPLNEESAEANIENASEAEPGEIEPKSSSEAEPAAGTESEKAFANESLAQTDPIAEKAIETEDEMTAAELASVKASEPELDPAIPLAVSEEAEVANETELPQEAELRETSAKPDGTGSDQPPRATKNKRPKKALIITAALLCLGAAGGYGVYHHQQVVAQEKQAKIDATLADLAKELQAFYLTEDQTFLQPNKTSADLTKLTTQLAKYSDQKQGQKLSEEAETLQAKLTAEEELNALFTEPVLVGDQLKKDIPLKAETPIQLATAEEKDAFYQLYDQGIALAQQQQQAFETAKKATEKVFANGQVVAKASREDYKKANELVSKLPVNEAQKELATELKQVDTVLLAQEKAAAEKAAQEKAAAAKKAAEQAAAQAAAEKAAAAAAAKQAQNSAANNVPAEASPNMQTNDSNQPILSTVAGDVADSGNAAWQWAPGIQEKVIQTCIDRGYIVAGGYTLERVRIENGEGYYNLFATNTNSALTKDLKQSALPYYIVTINCKTGYFRGNGNDHTIR